MSVGDRGICQRFITIFNSILYTNTCVAICSTMSFKMKFSDFKSLSSFLRLLIAVRKSVTVTGLLGLNLLVISAKL